MGLAAPKRRQLIQSDPNNNNWARNTATFGQKILRAAGWTPGEFLGAKDAAHASHHTAASASHIKVSLKEDNLGLGARRNNGDQCTGLDAFQDLLGRLNGKSEAAIEVEKEARMSVRRNLYVERKFGAMRFVQGGWLVGDTETKALEALAQEQKLKEEQVDGGSDKEAVVSEASDADSEESGATEVPEQRESRKRKAHDDTAEPKRSKKRRSGDRSDGETEGESREKAKKEKKAKKRKHKDGNEDSGDKENEDAAKEKEKKKKRKESKAQKDEPEATTGNDASEAEAATERSSKKEKKEKRRKKKENRDAKSDDESGSEQKRSKKKRRKEKESPAAATSQEDEPVASGTSTSTPTPAGSGTSTPIRHLARQRFIAQKRMAFSDPKALAQIFMMKSAS